MEHAWILVGMMGAGKSSVGRALAEVSGREFKDTDQMLQNRFGRSISNVFDLYGEPTFREHESSVLRTLEPGNYVLSTGGGIVTREENWAEMKRLGKTIFLDCTPAMLIDRLGQSKKKRPLLAGEDWQEKLTALLNQRLPLYRQADVTIRLDDFDVVGAAEHLYQELVRS
jgi:shikimate kinase